MINSIEENETNTIFVRVINRIITFRNYFPFQLVESHFIKSWKKKKFTQKEIKKKDGTLIEIMIFLDIAIGFFSLLLLPFFRNYNLYPILYILIFIGSLRIVDIIIYNIYAIKIATLKNVKSTIRILFLAIFNLIEIIVWFAFFYMINQNAFKSASTYLLPDFNSLQGSLFFLTYSINTLTSLGDSNVIINGILVRIIGSIEILLGLFILVIAISRYISLLNPK